MTTETPKYPEIRVELIGFDSNAMAIVGRVRRFMRHARDEDGNRIVSNEDLEAFGKEALSGDYDHVLQTCMRWVEVY